jgi:hydrophobe/amphiphile efflux-1 (HAE1) family protein
MIFSISTAFIKRPVLTTVISIVTILIGMICLALLPLDKLPQIAPQQVTVSANYIGADAKTTLDNVTTVIEREVNGVEDARWMGSNTSNYGQSVINVSFPVEKDVDIAQVSVQNRVSQANSNLPPVVQQTGVTTEKQSPSFTLVYSFFSDKGEDGKYIYDPIFINNYIDRFIWNEVRKIYGVGSLALIGGDTYAMRIWLDPSRLAARGLTASDVVNAVSEQNFEVGAGSIGASPAPTDQQFEIPLRMVGRFRTEEEANNIVIQVGSNGTLTRIRDVGRTELGSNTYITQASVDGKPGVTLVIYQLPGTNALETAEAIKAKMAELQESFPPGLEVDVTVDNTLFITASLEDLAITLAQAIGLVILVIFIFLQDWRTTLIPALAIPISLVGALIGLKAFGFSLNQLSLFALVLAAGLVVDDGIVVVEAVSNKLAQGMRPLQASIDAMEELFGAIISTTLVLLAVFIPVTFFPGTTGIVFTQFAMVIIFSILVSTLNALTFSPAMSAILLRRGGEAHGPLSVFFRKFNHSFDWFKGRYTGLIEFFVKIRYLIMVLFIAGLVGTYLIYVGLPQGFIPEEDQGYLPVIVEAPPGVSLSYTAQVGEKVIKIAQSLPNAEKNIESVVALTGFSFDGANSNKGVTFVKLSEWSERPGAANSAFGIIQQLNRRFATEISGARVFAVNAPAVDGLSSFGGLEMYIQDRQSRGIEALIDNAQRVMAAANQRPEIARAFTTFTFDSPMLEIDIDREKVKAQNVLFNEVLRTVQTYFGSNFVNQFVLDGRLYRVFVQADTNERANPQDLDRVYVRSLDGGLIQLSNIVSATPITYPPILTNYNTYPAIKINIAQAQGFSSGQAIQIMEELAQETLQPGFGFEWTNTAYEERASGGAAPIVFGLAFVMAFLVLAAQYESYVDPLIVMLTVPLSILGALGLIWLRATFVQTSGIWPILDNNMYAQVALVMLIGLAAKNAILIVEFANQSVALGMSITQAAVYAATERLRPILMTAVSGLVGFAPLLSASSVGSVSRWSLGTAVFGGLALATALSLVLVPILYIVIKTFERNILEGGKGGKGGKPPQSRQPKAPQPPTQPKEKEITPLNVPLQNE